MEHNKSINLFIEELDSDIYIERSDNYGSKSVQIGFSQNCQEVSCEFSKHIKLNNDLQHIVSVNISFCSLTSLPDCFATLAIKALNLSNNCLTKVPDCLFKGLNRLQNLNFSGNAIKEFDRKPLCVYNLKKLNLSNNKFANPPEWFLAAYSNNLEELYYNENSIESLSNHGYMKASGYKLSKVEFINSKIYDSDITFFKEICSLTSLNLSNFSKSNLNTIVSFESFFDKPKWINTIHCLYLNCVGMSFLPNIVSTLKYLSELHLERNNINWLPDNIIELEYLKKLYLKKNFIAFLPKDFSHLQSLEYLDCSYNSIGYADLSNMTRLKHLDLYSNQLDSFDIELENIEFIDLEDNFLCTETFAEYSIKRDRLRNTLDESEFRVIGPKIESNDHICSSSSVSSLESLYNENYMVIEQSSSMSYEESWDCHYENRRNNILSHSDDEFTGSVCQHKGIPKTIIYSTNDDIFEDAD